MTDTFIAIYRARWVKCSGLTRVKFTAGQTLRAWDLPRISVKFSPFKTIKASRIYFCYNNLPSSVKFFSLQSHLEYSHIYLHIYLRLLLIILTGLLQIKKNELGSPKTTLRYYILFNLAFSVSLARAFVERLGQLYRVKVHTLIWSFEKEAMISYYVTLLVYFISQITEKRDAFSSIISNFKTAAKDHIQKTLSEKDYSKRPYLNLIDFIKYSIKY